MMFLYRLKVRSLIDILPGYEYLRYLEIPTERACHMDFQWMSEHLEVFEKVNYETQ